jgi:hypothetical protein
MCTSSRISSSHVEKTTCASSSPPLIPPTHTHTHKTKLRSETVPVKMNNKIKKHYTRIKTALKELAAGCYC